MVSASHLLQFAGLAALLIAIPGPSVLFTIGRALTVGRRSALFSVAGNELGLCVQIAAVAFGVGALIERSAEIVTIVKYAGAAYLAFLGLQAIRHRQSMAEALAARIVPVSPLRATRDGFIVGATNPKTIVFFVIALPEFTDRAAGHLSGQAQMLIVGALFPVIALVLDSVWAAAAGTVRQWFARSPRRLALIGGAGGLVMIGLGVSIAATGRKDLSGARVMGVSKGSEAALLTGATYPDAVRSVISIVGSAVHTQGISQDVRTGSLLDILQTPVASWTYQGQDLPYLPNVVTPRLRAALAAGDPVSIGWAMPDLSDAAEVEPAMIPVDRIRGPVLLSAGDDGGYGAAYHEIAISRLRYPARHIVYEHAGHPIAGPPYRPTPRVAPPYRPTPRTVISGPEVDFRHSEIPAADAAARVGVWREVREFLQ